MKKIVSLILAISLLCSMFIPAFAAENLEENAIITAKRVLGISDEEYVIEDFSQNGNSYEMRWVARDEDSTDYISATVNDGEIISYYNRKKSNYDGRVRIPDVSKELAKINADAFLKKACPKIFETVKFDSSSFERYGCGIYNFEYTRHFNAIPVNGQNVYVEVSALNGDIIRLSTQYDYDLKLESSDGAIGFEKAKESYIKNFGNELKYIKKYSSDNNSYNAFLAYVPKNNDYNSYIDAISGEKIDIRDLMLSGKGFSEEVAADEAFNLKGSGSTSISKEEKLLADEIASLPKQEKAENEVKKIAEFGITDDFVLNDYSVSKSQNGKYYASLEFSNETQKRDDGYIYKFVRYNLSDSRVESYFCYNDSDTAIDKTKNTDYVNFSDSFIKKYFSNYVDETSREFDENLCTVNYKRVYDGIDVLSEGITFKFDDKTGYLVQMNFSWNDIKFESKKNIKSLDELYEKILSPDTLTLNYKVYKKYAGKNGGNAAKLVYKLENNFAIYSAKSLCEIDYNGEEPVEDEYLYDDIENHYVRPYAEKLSELGIGLEGTSLNPDESITKRDYLMLISMAENNYYDYLSESFAKAMISRGIIEKEDKTLDTYFSRMDAVRFMINNLGYKEIAEKNEIFNCPFADIPQNMVGYATLGAALGIVSDKSEILDAQSNLTRADALIIIYNYLFRE